VARQVRATDQIIPATPALAVERLVKRYGADKPVLDGVDLRVEAGSAVAIIGANGTGKSTLLRLLVRLVVPDEGRVVLLGEEVNALGGKALAKLRSRVGFVFQRHNLVTRLSALSNVIHGAQARASGPRTWHQALAPAPMRDEACECLVRVGLGARAMARVDSLSGGQSQRVAIARMLMQRPKFVIADEPDASLDPKSGEEIMDLLFGLTRERGLTLIFASHRMEHAQLFSDRIVGLADGRVAMDIAAANGSQPELRKFFDA